MGEHSRALSLVESAMTRTAGVAHIATKVFAAQHAAWLGLARRDAALVAANAAELARLAEEHDLGLWRVFGEFLQGWLAAQMGDVGGGVERMRRAHGLLLNGYKTLNFIGLMKAAQAEMEAAAGDAGRAVATLDEALATSERIGHRAFDADLHRVRGEMLLKRDPANPAPAKEALLTAIAVSKQQGTRSFGLRAALSLAKLHQSTGRLLEAHDVLAPALEGFSPTPEMPEIAEAQALLMAIEAGGHVGHE
jgi:predicted ATPase